MADEDKTQAMGADTADRGVADKVMDNARKAGDAMRSSGKSMAEGGSALGHKLIDQAENNTREAFAALRAAAGAKDWSDVMRIQGEFLREQGSRSMAQAREVGEMIAQIGREAVAPLRGGNDDKG